MSCPPTSDVARVYRPEWVVVHFAMAGDDGISCPGLLNQAQESFAATYAGRVRPEDVRYSCTGDGINAVAQLLLRLPNLKGEFKARHLADAYVRQMGWDDAQVVERNSTEDHELRAYGIRKLPA